ncbi:MAG TPA: DUF4342 domain-containing protein [Syntrophomonadaceae bacterium]|nr:DUF4342 domain-containing protein [Syntrophomonadaceae bacterium]
MDELLKKIDLIRERMDVSYREARDALDRASGDVVGALVLLEEEMQGGGLCEKLKETLDKGINAKLRLKKGDHTILEFSAGLGLAGVLGMLLSDELAILGAACTVAAFLSGCTLEIAGEEREEKERQIET